MPKGVNDGFRKADDRNLPKIDAAMLQEFYCSDQFLQPEVRNQKTGRATRECYADVALGYCQVKRDGDVCTVRALISPEQSVNNKNYHVICTINENKKVESITDAKCEDCVASAGGCKHIIAFVSWLHRKSAGDSITSKPCVWKRPKLSAVSEACYEIRDIVTEIAPPPTITEEIQNSFLGSLTAQLEGFGSPSTFRKYYSYTHSPPPPYPYII